MSGFYLNELLLKLTERCDPHPEIFDAYAPCIEALVRRRRRGGDLAALREAPAGQSGLRPGARRARPTASRSPSTATTDSQVERGPQPCVAEAPGAVYGRSLADLEAETFADARSLRDAKRVLRAAIDACLDGRALKSREVMLAMRRRAT